MAVMNIKLLENVFEITSLFKELESDGRLFSSDELETELNLVNTSLNEEIRGDIISWAVEFLQQQHEDPEDYIGNITSFAKPRILEKYGQISVEICSEYTLRFTEYMTVKKDDYEALANGKNPFCKCVKDVFDACSNDYKYTLHHRENCIVDWDNG